MRHEQTRLLHASLLAATFLLCPVVSHGEPPVDIGNAAAKYYAGHTQEAIDDLERLLSSLDYQAAKIPFIQAARTLLNLYWRADDAAGIGGVRKRMEAALKDRQPLDDADKFMLAYLETYRVRELLLYGNHSAARQYGLALLEILQASGPVYSPARLDLLLTLAMISRAQFELSEAESLMHQAIAVALQDPNFSGLPALELLESLLRHYMESGQYQSAALVAERLKSAPNAFNAIPHQSIAGFSFALQFAELLLQRLPPESSQPLLQFLLDHERVQGSIQRLPLRLTVQLYALLLYLRLHRNEPDPALEAFSALEALYKSRAPDARAIANLLAWAAHRLRVKDAAARYLAAGHSDTNELNLFLYPLNRSLAARFDLGAGRSSDAAAHAQEAFTALLKVIAARSFAAPSAPISLSFVERTLVIDLINVALDLLAANQATPLLKEQLSVAVQVLQRDRVPRGALFAPALRTAPTANLEEHLRAREHLGQARHRALLAAVDLLLGRVAMTSGGSQPAFAFGEASRFLEYTFRLNALDQHLKPLLYSQRDFLSGMLALVPPKDLQHVLASDEAVISHAGLPPNRLIIECLTRDSIDFFSVPFDPYALESDIKLLNLSVSATHQPSPILDRQYPAGSAVAIFQTLFAPAAACLSGKTRVILATDAALLGIPFNALLTAMPLKSSDGYDLRHAPWLSRTWALSVSLARSTLLYQRSRQPLTRPRKSLLAIANPRFDGSPMTRVADTRSVYTARGTARIEAIRGLPALPDTEAEVRAIQSHLGESAGELFLAEGATERSVRSLDLDNYRVVVFATHGLTAGDFNSLAEPALALTPGHPDDTRNDGLLTMSEISRLWIPAELVVLSACNTAAGNGTPSSYGFGGLVNAFLSAGAQAVLASQWPVFSQMAEALTTGMFSELATDPALPLSAALQRAMLRIIDERPEPEYAHPRFWAPFLVVGDGARSSQFLAGPGTPPTRPPMPTRWERNLGEKLAGEILAVSAAPDGTVYAMGYTEPKNDRVKSIVLALDSHGTERWRVEDSVIGSARQLLRYDSDRLAAVGSLWSQEQFQGTVLRGFNTQNGDELWRVVVDTPQHDGTLALLSGPDDNLLWVVGSHPDKPDAKAGKFTISLLTINKGGAVVGMHTQDLSGSDLTFSFVPAAGRWRGNVVLAVNGWKNVASAEEMFGKASRDLFSGYSTACATKNFARLLLFEESTGRLLSDKTIENIHLKSFAVSPDGRLLAAADQWDTCLGPSDATVADVAADLSIKTIFRYGGPLEKFAHDIAVFPDGQIMVVGSTNLVFDIDPYVKQDRFDVSSFWRGFTGELFANDRRTSSAFIIALDRSGSFIGDRIIRDLRGRSIRAATARTDGSLLFGGLANGISGWLGILDRVHQYAEH